MPKFNKVFIVLAIRKPLQLQLGTELKDKALRNKHWMQEKYGSNCAFKRIIKGEWHLKDAHRIVEVRFVDTNATSKMKHQKASLPSCSTTLSHPGEHPRLLVRARFPHDVFFPWKQARWEGSGFYQLLRFTLRSGSGFLFEGQCNDKALSAPAHAPTWL